jgi:hypothetical protein
MPVNYTNAAATASRLIEENGRAITLVKLNQTPTDVDKPWRGTTDARNVPELSLAAFGVFVSPSGGGLGFIAEDSEMVRLSEQIVLVAAASLSGYKVEDFNEIIDPEDNINTRWRITKVEMLKPGPVRILYAIGVKR